MFICTNFHSLRQDSHGISDIHLKKPQFLHRVGWLCLPARIHVRGLAGTNRLQSQVNIGLKRTSLKSNMSTQILESLNSNKFKKESLQDMHLSSAYEIAMEALSSLITRQNRSDRSKVGGKYNKLERMLMYVKILGLEESIAGLKVIHVAGTKGKGSTCAFCEAILRECGLRTGLFTSPHLIDVRERFRLNGLDISEDKFLKYFWDCWNQLKGNMTEDLPMPPLFQFLTVLAFTIFVGEKVDVAIIEVGLGGTTDSTNVIKEPVVCGITSLGMDHMESLGSTLAEIASHKAGIFKPQVPAFTVPQLSEAMYALQERANELMVPLDVVPPLEHIKLDGRRLSLSGDHQLTNAALAVSLCKSWLHSTGNWEKLFKNAIPSESLPEAFIRGLSTARLAGRAQIVHDSFSMPAGVSEVNESSSGDLIFYLDGAHSPESMEACAKWFSNAAKENECQSSSPARATDKVSANGYTYQRMGNKSNKLLKQVLLFNCMDVRDPQILLPKLVKTCASSGTYFSKAIFVPSISTYSKVTSGSSTIRLDIPPKDLNWQFNLQRIWEKIIHGKDVSDKSVRMDTLENLPVEKFLYEDVSDCNPAEGHFACSMVVPSLPQTINWLRDCVKANPSLRIQVLVTGSLHLVGDVLKLIRR